MKDRPTPVTIATQAVVVGLEPLPRLRQLVEVLEVAGVLGLGTIQGDEHDVLGSGRAPSS